MNKKEIYEHLANIYLDASSKSSKKKHKLRHYPKSILALIVLGSLFVLGISTIITYPYITNHNKTSQIALFLYQDAAKINFNFDPAKKETFSLNLKQLNLSKYKALGFTVRKTNSKDIISLRVEFTSRFNERSEVYINDISGKWTEQRFDFSRFAKITDWQQMKTLAFSVEEWNAREKSGIVYLDNIRVLK